jgi:hypothetical protein
VERSEDELVHTDSQCVHGYDILIAMPDVLFTEETPQKKVIVAKRSLLVRLAYSTGIPKNDTEAQYVLLGVVALCLLVGIVLAGHAPKRTPITPNDPTWPRPVQQHNL